MNFPVFDLHCDTLTVAMDNGHQLRENDLQLSFEKGKKFIPFFLCLFEKK